MDLLYILHPLFVNLSDYFSHLNLIELSGSFLALFAIVDVVGSVPIFLKLRSENKTIEPMKVAVYSFFILLLFFFVGEVILNLFNVDRSSFAVAGAIIIIVLAAEMLFGIEIFKYDGNESGSKSATLVPVVFPLITGPGTFTTLLSMKTAFHDVNILLALLLNMVIVFLVIKFVDFVKRVVGVAGVYFLRKFFAVILLAIAVRLITLNINSLIASFS